MPDAALDGLLDDIDHRWPATWEDSDDDAPLADRQPPGLPFEPPVTTGPPAGNPEPPILDDPPDDPLPVGPIPTDRPADPGPGDPPPAELVVDPSTGRVRQAGADQADGQWVVAVRVAAERSLYTFAKAILGRSYLTAALHRPVCDWFQRTPPRRKLLLMPREHAKTTIASHALPLHLLIQPADANGYIAGLLGLDTRILLCGETERRATDNLRTVAAALETNARLRAFWPACVWDAPRRQAPKWNDRELIVPRTTEYPDPTIRAVGVDAAVTGAHPLVLIKDDLISIDAANSPVVMQTAIQWHVASRALINDDRALEFIIGTRWAVSDLYAHIIETDPSVETQVHAVIEDGRPIYPEMFTLEKIARLQREFGVLFPLLYMNAATDPELTDFDASLVRAFAIEGDRVRFASDPRDLLLHDRLTAPPASPGRPAVRTLADVFGREAYVRAKYS